MEVAMHTYPMARFGAVASPIVQRLEEMRARHLADGRECSPSDGQSRPPWTAPTAEQAALILAQSGLAPLERKLSLATVARHRHQRAAVEMLRRYLADWRTALESHQPPPEWWIVLAGRETGTGKSHLAAALVADLCRLGVRAMYLPEVRMTDALRAACRADTEFGITQLRERWSRAPVLVLDDLGADRPTEFAARELYGLIEARRRARRGTIITTNSDPDAMEQHYDAVAPGQGRRITSRIMGMCGGGRAWLDMNGPDLRAAGEVALPMGGQG